MSQKVYIDHRELRSGIAAALNECQVDFEIVHNQSTDYIIGDCGIERKTMADFKASLVDRRLLDQALYLKSHFPKPLIILEGGGIYQTFNNNHPNFVRGVLLWLSLEIKVPVIRACDLDDTAQLIKLLYRKKNRIKITSASKCPRPNKPLPPPGQQKQKMLKNIQGIGPEMACLLISQLGSIEAVIAAGPERLAQIRGIGPTRARNIHKALTQ